MKRRSNFANLAGKSAPSPSEAEKAAYRLLVTAHATPEERRKAVRLLLREASQSSGPGPK